MKLTGIFLLLIEKNKSTPTPECFYNCPLLRPKLYIRVVNEKPKFFSFTIPNGLFVS